MIHLLHLFGLLQRHTRTKHEQPAPFRYTTRRLAVSGMIQVPLEVRPLPQATSSVEPSAVADAANAFMSYFRGNVKALRAGTLSEVALARGEALRLELMVQLLSARPLTAGESAPWLDELYAMPASLDLGHYAQFLSTYLARLKGRMAWRMRGPYSRWALKVYPVVTIEQEQLVVLLAMPGGDVQVQTTLKCPFLEGRPQTLKQAHGWAQAVTQQARLVLDTASKSLEPDANLDAEQRSRAELRQVYALADQLTAQLSVQDASLLLKHRNMFNSRFTSQLSAAV